MNHPGGDQEGTANVAIVGNDACSSSIHHEDHTVDVPDLIRQLGASDLGDLPVFSDHCSISTASTKSFADDEQSWRRERSIAFYDVFMKGGNKVNQEPPQSPLVHSSYNSVEAARIPGSPPTPIIRNDSERLFRPKGRRFLERHRSHNNLRSLSLNSVLSDLESTSYRAIDIEIMEEEDLKCSAKDLPDDIPPEQELLLVEIMPGIHAPLRGSNETRTAVRNDFYAPIICQVCSLEHLCIADAAYALCPRCQSMNSMSDECFDGCPVKRSGLGLGFTYESLLDLSNEILGSELSRPY